MKTNKPGIENAIDTEINGTHPQSHLSLHTSLAEFPRDDETRESGYTQLVWVPHVRELINESINPPLGSFNWNGCSMQHGHRAIVSTVYHHSNHGSH